MIPLLMSFFVLGSLLCALIGADEQGGADPGLADPDPLEPWRSGPARVEVPPEAETESGRPAPGLAGDR
jgi:hypothetical protein